MVVLYFSSSPNLCFSADSGCRFDRENPSIDNARQAYRMFDDICAIEELQVFINSSGHTREAYADAYILLATIHYYSLTDDKEKNETVGNEFLEAFRADPNLQKVPEDEDPGLQRLFEDARARYAAESSEVVVADSTAALTDESMKEEGKKSGAWYKKWWAIGLGAGIVGGVVAAVAGGGSDSSPTTIPEIPQPPGD